ncbi:MAG: hypothetical protein RB148_12990, partial [Armatimonadota bacterium]|nr:hypothetical protein [Armatimonadota bacterium]
GATGRLATGAASTALLLLIAGSLGLAVYVTASWSLRVEEIRAVRDLLWRRMHSPGAPWVRG